MHYDRLILLWGVGLRSEGIGPHEEWDPVPPGDHQVRHNTFWKNIAGMISSEPGDYDDLPEWMTETASQQLEANI